MGEKRRTNKRRTTRRRGRGERRSGGRALRTDPGRPRSRERGREREREEEKRREGEGRERGLRSDTTQVGVFIGLGMVRRTGVAEAMFRALTEVGINIQMITTSEIKISVLVDRSEAKAALRAVHQAFELDAEPAPKLPEAGRGEQVSTADVADVLSRLRGVDMEELFLDEITLDQQQARVTMNGVPDSPGIAADPTDYFF